MRHLLLDTNAIIDLMANRAPFSKPVAQLISLSIDGKLKIYASSLSYSNIYYILKRSKSHKQVIQLLEDFFALTEIVEVSRSTISNALSSDFKDLEDAIQYQCAISIKKIEMIVSRDAKGFAQSVLPVMTPKEALVFLLN